MSRPDFLAISFSISLMFSIFKSRSLQSIPFFYLEVAAAVEVVTAVVKEVDELMWVLLIAAAASLSNMYSFETLSRASMIILKNFTRTIVTSLSNFSLPRLRSRLLDSK